MKRHLKIAINFLASLVVMVSGTMQAAQADEVWLDFSVPKADVVLTSNAVASPSSHSQAAVTNKAIAQKSLVKASENDAKLIALDFSVPKVDSLPVPVATEISGETQPNNLKLTPSPAQKPSSKPSIAPTIKTPAPKLLLAETRSKQVTALRRAIIGQESAGKFNIVNPHSGALGYGQVMPENVAPWSRAALGREVSGAEFLNNPDLQLLVIDHKLGQYFNRALQITGGDEATAVKRVAAIWYSGNPNLYASTMPQFYNGHPYPSIADYSQSVLQRYQQLRN
jgi:hypothetical protein